MFFFAPFSSNIMCGMRAQYIPFPCYKSALFLPLWDFVIVSSPWVCQFPKIRFSKPSKAVKVKTTQRGVAVFVPFKQGSMCLVIVMSSQ